MTKTHELDAAPHLRQVLRWSDRQRYISRGVDFFKNRPHIHFDTFACAGLSGLLFAPAIADALNVDITVVRKVGESCHSHRYVEGPKGNNLRYIIIDDLIDSGKTIRHIIDRMTNYRETSKLVGIYLYFREPCKDMVDRKEQVGAYSQTIGVDVPIWLNGIPED